MIPEDDFRLISSWNTSTTHRCPYHTRTIIQYVNSKFTVQNNFIKLSNRNDHLLKVEDTSWYSPGHHDTGWYPLVVSWHTCQPHMCHVTMEHFECTNHVACTSQPDTRHVCDSLTDDTPATQHILMKVFQSFRELWVGRSKLTSVLH